MTAPTSQIRAALTSSTLAGRTTLEVAIPKHDVPALLVEIGAREVHEAWREARRALAGSGWWPVGIAAWGHGATWREAFSREPLFERSAFANDPGAGGSTAKDLLRRAEALDLARALDELPHDPYDHLDLDLDLDATEARVGSAPSEAEARPVLDGADRASEALEKWLLDFEREREGPDAAPEEPDARFVPEHALGAMPTALALLPTDGPGVLAFYPWYGAEAVGTPLMIALLRAWEARYGARLVGHFGTMLNLEVTRPPRTLDEAFEVACIHARVAPCTLALPGQSIRARARSLVGATRWFLHERP